MFRLFYRLLLLAWPRRFRRDNADEAARVFAEACAHDRRTRGIVSLFTRVGRATIEVPARGFAERARIRFRSRRQAGSPAPGLSHYLSELLSDARFSVRSLRRSPAYAVTALLTMTIGIGLSTAMFTTFNAVGLRGWPIENADSVVVIHALKSPRLPTNLDDLARFQRSSSVVAVAGSRRAFHSVALQPDGRGEGGFGQYVTPSYFDAIGVRFALGRNFGADEDRPGAPSPVIIISHALWQNLFAGARDVIGRTVYIRNRRPGQSEAAFTVIGVTREGWRGEQPYRQDFWLPLQTLRQFLPDDSLFSREAGQCCLDLLGRLKPDVDRERAEEELSLLMAPAADGSPQRVRLSGTSMIDRMPASFRAAAWSIVVLATALVLLLTGANIAHLQLARAMARAKETRTRLALGAGRGRVVRQLVTESILLTLVAGSFAMVLVFALLGTLMRISELPMPEVWTPNLTVYGYSVLAALAMSLTFGLLPALRSTRVSLAHAVGQSSTPVRLRFNLALLTTQIALSASLLTGGALINRALTQAIRGNAGFPIDGLMVVTYEPAPAMSATRESARAFRLAVEHAANNSGLGPVGLLDIVPYMREGMLSGKVRTGDAPAAEHTLDLAPMSASAFNVLGIQMSQGRAFAEGSESEAVINDSAARRLWPEGGAVGRTVTYGTRTFTVVGVTRDVYYTTRDAIRPMLHIPAGVTRRFPAIVVRADTRIAADRLTSLLNRLDPEAIVYAKSLSERIATRLGDEQAGAQAAWAGGLLALALATFGVFGVFAFVVEERRSEIGIRVALGAQRRDVLRALFRPARIAVLAGLSLGLVLSLMAGPILVSMRINLFGLSPFDPIAFGTVGVILGAAALIATFIPVRRALAVDPAVILKEDA
jgi:putative ABC transport system permease protein